MQKSLYGRGRVLSLSDISFKIARLSRGRGNKMVLGHLLETATAEYQALAASRSMFPVCDGDDDDWGRAM
jgi:hypothetical protein